jgi:hypothetical protein
MAIFEPFKIQDDFPTSKKTPGFGNAGKKSPQKYFMAQKCSIENALSPITLIII